MRDTKNVEGKEFFSLSFQEREPARSHLHKHIPEYNKKNVRIARLLRRTMTDAERKLWSLLRNNQLGVKFRRQVPFGEHVLDFYCPAAKLCVELDGSQHYSQDGLKSDVERDDDLRDHGIEVVRYSNAEFLRNTDGVVQGIFDRVQHRLQKRTLASPPSTRERGS